ncbi:hypothetical protein ACA910_020141 [Epithemia clementina (nom. ined.)]
MGKLQQRSPCLSSEPTSLHTGDLPTMYPTPNDDFQLASEPREVERSIIKIRGGVLDLQPDINIDRLLKCLLLSKGMGIIEADLDLNERNKQLQQIVDFLRSTGCTFVDTSSPDSDPPSNNVVIDAILQWMGNVSETNSQASGFQFNEQFIDVQQPQNATHRIDNTFSNIMQGFPRVHETTIPVASVREETSSDLAMQESNQSILLSVDLSSDDRNYLLDWAHTIEPVDKSMFESAETIPGDTVEGSTISVDEDFRASNVFRATTEHESPQEDKPPQANSTTSSSPQLKPEIAAPEEHTAPALAGCKRTLDDLRDEFYARHPKAKRRCIHKSDVVSGKGEKSKIQNEEYLELIRDNAPFFRSMNTGDPNKNLNEKRRLAYCIALEIVNRCGCFLGTDSKPLEANKAFKRVMTSLKDWRKPSEKKSRRHHNNNEATSHKKQSKTLAPSAGASNHSETEEGSSELSMPEEQPSEAGHVSNILDQTCTGEDDFSFQFFGSIGDDFDPDDQPVVAVFV